MSGERPAPATGTGPSENATKPLKDQSSAVGASVVPIPLRWARALIEAADGPVPTYGSVEWSSLPDDNRAKVAACVQAAEMWRGRNYRAEGWAPDAHPSRRAREIAEARRPRPGDYMGGPVQWDEATNV